MNSFMSIDKFRSTICMVCDLMRADVYMQCEAFNKNSCVTLVHATRHVLFYLEYNKMEMCALIAVVLHLVNKIIYSACLLLLEA